MNLFGKAYFNVKFQKLRVIFNKLVIFLFDF